MPRKKKKTEPGSHPRTLPELVLLANKRKQNRTSAKTLQNAFYRSIYSYIYIYIYILVQFTLLPNNKKTNENRRLARKKKNPDQSVVDKLLAQKKKLSPNNLQFTSSTQNANN